MNKTINDFFRCYRFEDWNDYKYKHHFDFVFKNDVEIYLIKVFDIQPKADEINTLENYIYEYIVLLSNDHPYKYSMNLIICYPFEKIPHNLSFESNKYTCRKYFLNTSNNDTLYKDFLLLPFFQPDYQIDYTQSTISIDTILKRKLGEKVYDIVVKDELKLEDISKLEME